MHGHVYMHISKRSIPTFCSETICEVNYFLYKQIAITFKLYFVDVSSNIYIYYIVFIIYTLTSCGEEIINNTI